MNEIHIVSYQSPVGEMILGSYSDTLCLADWKTRKDRQAVDKRLQKSLDAQYLEASSVVIENAIKQLDLYFSQKQQDFDIPLLLCGTDFQKSVWKALLDIPFSQTASYLDLAKRLGKEKAVRAVATAVGANALSLLIPCHRIIGSDGSLTGYAGGLETKKRLLLLENSD